MSTNLHFRRLSPRRFLRVLHNRVALDRLHIETIELMVPHHVAVVGGKRLLDVFEPRQGDSHSNPSEIAESRTAVGRVLEGGHLLADAPGYDYPFYYFTPDEVEAEAQALFNLSPSFSGMFDASFSGLDRKMRQDNYTWLRKEMSTLVSFFLAAADEDHVIIRFWF